MTHVTVEKILRIGLAFAFLYPAIAAWFNPFAWVGYFPSFLLTLAGGHELILLHIFGVSEIIIALWLLWGRKIIVPASLAAVYLVGIIAFNLNQMDVVFRDISILAIAIALIVTHTRERTT